MTKPQDISDSAPHNTDEIRSTWVAERLAELMAKHGVAERQQAGLLVELCNLSFSQARRKLRGAMWTFDEVMVVAQHFGASLDQLFADAASGIDHAALSPEALAPLLQDATFLMDKLAIPCKVRLGDMVVGTPGNDELLVAQDHEGWLVGIQVQLESHHSKLPYYRADQILLTPHTVKQPVRIAILDDDLGTSETLGEWFNAAGYAATAFTSCDQLLAAGPENFDAFLVDFMLASGDSSQAIIKNIRQALPKAPILLLTGKLRDGQASEAELSTMLRTSNVLFFEKPVRPSILAAAIGKELDQIASRHAE